MALQGKLETEIEVTAPADMFYSIFKTQIQHLPDIATTNIQGVQHEGGDWETHGHGSIKVWNYTAGDEVGVFKEKVEFNDEKKSMTLNGIEGNPFERYKSLKLTYQFTQKDQVTIANLSIEYEKLNADVANPDHYMDVMINIVKDLDAHIAQDLDD